MIQVAFGNPLLCSNCGGESIHPEEVYLLSSDDDYYSNVVTYVTIQDAPTRKYKDIKTPNRNRSLSVAIDFWCEHCDQITHRSFMFHKGSTYQNAGHGQFIEDTTMTD